MNSSESAVTRELTRSASWIVPRRMAMSRTVLAPANVNWLTFLVDRSVCTAPIVGRAVSSVRRVSTLRLQCAPGNSDRQCMCAMDAIGANSNSPRAPRLLEQVRDAVRRLHYSPRTEETYVQWIKRFIYFSGKRHPAGLGAAEVTAFLNYLSRERAVAAATQNQALSALLFLYRR